MKNFLFCLGTVVSLGMLLPTQAQAATATSTFNVTVNLTPKCEITTAPGNLSLNYESFQTTDATASTSFALRCTSTLPYTLSVSAPTGPLVGLTYTLAVRNAGDTAAATGGFGTGLTGASFNVRATIASGQSGTCATAQTTATACSATDNARTLTVTY
jgi:Spore Coat Protein U domain